MLWTSTVSKSSRKGRQLSMSLGSCNKAFFFAQMWQPEDWTSLKSIGLSNMTLPKIFVNTSTGWVELVGVVVQQGGPSYCSWNNRKGTWSTCYKPRLIWTNTNSHSKNCSRFRMNSNFWLRKTDICLVKPTLHSNRTYTPTLLTVSRKSSMCTLWIWEQWPRATDWKNLHMST